MRLQEQYLAIKLNALLYIKNYTFNDVKIKFNVKIIIFSLTFCRFSDFGLNLRLTFSSEEDVKGKQIGFRFLGRSRTSFRPEAHTFSQNYIIKKKKNLKSF